MKANIITLLLSLYRGSHRKSQRNCFIVPFVLVIRIYILIDSVFNCIANYVICHEQLPHINTIEYVWIVKEIVVVP